VKYDSPKMTAWAAGEDEIEKKKISLPLVKTKRWEGEVRITTFRVLKKGRLWGKCIKEERSQQCYHEKPFLRFSSPYV